MEVQKITPEQKKRTDYLQDIAEECLDTLTKHDLTYFESRCVIEEVHSFINASSIRKFIKRSGDLDE